MTGNDAWIGRAVTRADSLTERLLSQFRATLSPYLHETGTAGLAPPGLHWCLAVAAHDSDHLGPDGAEAKGLFLPPVTLPRRMWAGGRLQHFAPISLGDDIQRRSTVVDVRERDGRSGKLCIVSVQHDVHANGVLAVRELHDILFRAAGTPGAAAPADEAETPPSELWNVELTPLMLFRFSAITFNGHRIHYDLPYARESEGYDGLLVHGPLQAALALNQMASLRGSVPPDVTYRCLAPLTAPQTCRIESRRVSDQIETVILDASGVRTFAAIGIG